MKTYAINILLTVSSVALSIMATAQTELQKVIPLSPEAASIVRYGETPIGYFTGVPSINIPIYTIKSRDMQLPVSLSYHAGGNRVEDVSPWVGLGWSLNTLPSISRSVHGLPDENGYFYKFQGNTVKEIYDNRNSSSTSQSLFNFFLEYANIGNADPEPDVFYYTLANKSGKFFFNQQTQQFTTYPRENIQISFDGTNFKIVGDDGVQYVFNNRESIVQIQNGVDGPQTTTAWDVTTMTSANRTDTITFTYNLEIENSTSLGTQVKYMHYSGGGCVSPNDVNIISYNEASCNKIATISFNKGTINFNPGTTMRSDLNGGYPLSNIIIKNTDNSTINRFDLEYHTLLGSGSGICSYSVGSQAQGWLVLDKIKENGTFSTDQKVYSFDYNEAVSPPCRLSAAQDYWGFYNGASNNTDLIPPTNIVYPDGGVGTRLAGADRSFNPNYSQFGIIQKVNYPTGGYTDFRLENHIVDNNTVPTSYADQKSELRGQTVSSPPTYYSASFNINNLADPILNNGNPAGGSYVNVSIGDYGCDISNGVNECAVFHLQGTSQNNSSVSYYVHQNLTGLYLPNGSYTMDASFDQDPQQFTHFFFQVFWQKVDMASVNYAGGLRVRSMTDYDGISHNNDIVRTFDYSMPGTAKSSGEVFGIPYFNYSDLVTDYSVDSQQKRCLEQFLRRTAFSNVPSISSSGSFVGYKTVTVHSDGNDQNGKSVYTFTSPMDIGGTNFPYPPAIANEVRRGLLTESFDYARKNGTYAPVKHVVNTYIDANLGLSTFALKVANNTIGDPRFTGSSLYISAQNYDLSSDWIQLQTSTETIYDPNDQTKYLTKAMNYEYANPLHYLLTKTWFADSKGREESVATNYPQDLVLSGDAEDGRKKLILQNNVAIPLLQQKKVAGNNIQLTVTNFKDFGTNLIFPSDIHLQVASKPMETRMQFNQYDKFGNILEQQKTNGVKEVYLYGYNSQYPVAKIIGSDYKTASALVNQSILDNPTTDAAMRTELAKLRTGLPNAMVSTYTYAPLIGTTSETSPNGTTTYYEYDGMGRLYLARDKDNNIIKRYCYNYAGQLGGCPASPAASQPICNPVSCSAMEGYKCIGGSCELGYRENTMSMYNGNMIASGRLRRLPSWSCTYHYIWSDGSISQDYREVNPAPCNIDQHPVLQH